MNFVYVTVQSIQIASGLHMCFNCVFENRDMKNMNVKKL